MNNNVLIDLAIFFDKQLTRYFYFSCLFFCKPCPDNNEQKKKELSNLARSFERYALNRFNNIYTWNHFYEYCSMFLQGIPICIVCMNKLHYHRVVYALIRSYAVWIQIRMREPKWLFFASHVSNRALSGVRFDDNKWYREISKHVNYLHWMWLLSNIYIHTYLL